MALYAHGFDNERLIVRESQVTTLKLQPATRITYMLSSFKLLLDASPESESKRDGRVGFLLHRLATCPKGFMNKTFNLVLKANPGAIESPDYLGMLLVPLHDTILNKASSLENLICLIKEYPESLLVKL
mmetsp:Transcript_11630/g.16721  ORF Transcript_11630/g.16721 Transcript_11630/m.16721 type:complete len:129 (-) Transcript_11630:6-392(-)